MEPLKEGEPRDVLLSKYMIKQGDFTKPVIGDDYYRLLMKEFYLIGAKEKEANTTFFNQYCNLISLYSKCTDSSVNMLIETSLAIEGLAFKNYKLTIYLLRIFMKQ